MHSIVKGILTASAIGILVPLFSGTPGSVADAAIRCNGPYQVIRGQGEIATPFCEDNYLARVARGYGMNVSNRTIRQNPHKKQEACHLVGHDTRVADICAGFRDGSRDRD